MYARRFPGVLSDEPTFKIFSTGSAGRTAREDYEEFWLRAQPWLNEIGRMRMNFAEALRCNPSARAFSDHVDYLVRCQEAGIWSIAKSIFGKRAVARVAIVIFNRSFFSPNGHQRKAA